MIRTLTLAFAATALAAGGWAQETRPAAELEPPPPADRPPDEELIRRCVDKMASEWIRLTPWILDFDAARAEAKRSGKTIFAYFSRSYAPCAPCTKLENSLFSDNGAANPAFVKWAEDHVLLLHVTSYVFSDPHHDLFAERGGFGHPYLAFLDAEGQWLAGEHGVLSLEQCAELAQRARDLQQQASAEDDNQAQVAVFLTRLRHEALSLAEARARREQLASQLSDEQAEEVEQLIVNREIAAELAALRRRFPEHSELRRATAPKAAELFRAGKVPTNRLAPHYMEALFGYARATKDRELYTAALAKIEELFAANENYSRVIARYREQLEAWK